MISTWADFTAAVRSAYWTAGTPTLAQQYRAVADLAHSLFVRQTESDLPLAKSFSDSYDVAKLKLAGSRISTDLPTTTAAVKLLLPVDSDTDGTQTLLSNAIEQAYDDFNGTADRFDVEVLNAAMDLQRHVPFYQGRNETVYTSTTAGLSNQGFVSQILLPSDFRIQSVWATPYHASLAENVAYASGDKVESNGRFYEVITGGSLTTGQLGNGLVNQDYTVETLGALTFKFKHEIKSVPVRKWAWADREAMYSGRLKDGPHYTVSPQFDKLWLYPALVDGKQFFMLEWAGVKTSYQDTDPVTFDIQAAQAAAQYVRAILAKESGDTRGAGASVALYQQAVRNAVIDNQARDSGTTNTTSELLAMNLGKVPWWRWSIMNACSNNGQLSSGNSEEDSNSVSAPLVIAPLSPNHVERISFTGAAGPRTVALSKFGPSPTSQVLVRGSRMVVLGTFDSTVGIAVTFLNGNGGSAIPNATFTSDGVNLQIALEFYYNGTDWEYLRAQIPA